MDAGKILFQGKDITKVEPHQAARLGIARTFQNIRLFGNLSVKSNVEISCNMNAGYHLGDALLGTPRYRRVTKETEDGAMEFLKIVGLADKGEERREQSSVRTSAKAGDCPCDGDRIRSFCCSMSRQPV